jgi:ABC-type microcin C transport system permease subunit YejB
MAAITAISSYLFATILCPMLRYIVTRLLYMVPVIWLVVSVVFLLIHLVPGDPIQQMLGENAASADVQAPATPMGSMSAATVSSKTTASACEAITLGRLG